MRSTARWVLPVLVGPSTAASRAGGLPVGRSLMRIIWGPDESRASSAAGSAAGRRGVQAEAVGQQGFDGLARLGPVGAIGDDLAAGRGEFPDLLPAPAAGPDRSL